MHSACSVGATFECSSHFCNIFPQDLQVLLREPLRSLGSTTDVNREQRQLFVRNVYDLFHGKISHTEFSVYLHEIRECTMSTKDRVLVLEDLRHFDQEAGKSQSSELYSHVVGYDYEEDDDCICKMPFTWGRRVHNALADSALDDGSPDRSQSVPKVAEVGGASPASSLTAEAGLLPRNHSCSNLATNSTSGASGQLGPDADSVGYAFSEDRSNPQFAG